MSTCNNDCPVFKECGYEYKGNCDCVQQRKFKPIEPAPPEQVQVPVTVPKAKKEFYHVWYKCKNCGYEASKQVPFAVEAPRNEECSNCGCKSMQPTATKKPPYR